jgi:hypothetical protein
VVVDHTLLDVSLDELLLDQLSAFKTTRLAHHDLIEFARALKSLELISNIR